MAVGGLNVEYGDFDFDAGLPGDLEELALAVSLHVQGDDACGAVAARQTISDLQPSAHASKLDVEEVRVHEGEDTSDDKMVRSMAKCLSHSQVRLPDADLQELVRALRSNRLEAPYTQTGVQRIVSSPHVSEIAVDLQGLADQGFSSFHIATTMELMVQARSQRPLAEDLIDLVTTGPEAPGVSNRDTGVVVRELFAHAQYSVLVAGYAVYQGQRVFQTLANRMEEIPALKVQMFLDVQRGHGDTATSSEIARRFADRFRKKQWPEQRKLPEVFFDPRALEADAQKKACLHAKCVVVDRRDLFVSSANFTEAAQERNLEVGLLIHSPVLAQRVQRYFETLLDARLLAQLL